MTIPSERFRLSFLGMAPPIAGEFAFRRKTLPPLDDELGWLKGAIANLSGTLPAVCRVIASPSRLPVEETQERPQEVQNLKRSATSTSKVVNCVMPRASWSCFWPATGVSKLHSRRGPRRQEGRLKSSSKPSWRSFPYKIHTVLTDNGMAFADLPKNRKAPAAASSARTSSTASAWQTP
jgi:hypothetical protein